MNRKGFTALVDAAFFIALIGIATTVIVHTVDTGEADPDVQSPSSVLDEVFNGKVRYTDLGIDIETSLKASMPRVAYVSLALEDGRFEEYIERILDTVYPWENSYHLTVQSSKGSIEVGEKGTEAWITCEKTYETGFSDDLRVCLTIYR